MNFNRSYFPKKKFFFALSGGVDSIAACHLFHSLGLDFDAIHVNCQFIEQDTLVATKVKDFCKHYGISLVECKEENTYLSGSKEDHCRTVRYEAIRKKCAENDIDIMVTAHHLDDCVESYFMNFLKGQANHVPIRYICEYPECKVVRPFLLNKKIDFIGYSRDNDIMKFATEDELNSDMSLTRNWTRKEVLPFIEKRYKGLSKVAFKIMKTHMDSVIML